MPNSFVKSCWPLCNRKFQKEAIPPVFSYTSTMMRCAVVLAFCLSCSLAFAQLDSNSVTVTASRSSNLQSDEALFSVTVSSSRPATTLDEAVAALQGTGITVSNLAGVSAGSTGVSTVTTWATALSQRLGVDGANSKT